MLCDGGTEQGLIPFRKVGTYHRIPLEKALEYKRKLEADRGAALAKLVAYDQEIGLRKQGRGSQ